MVDIESSKRVLSMLRRTKAALPDIIDRANQSGDYSEVDQAHKTMDRLLALGDQHIQAIKSAVGQDKMDGHGYAQNHPLAADTPPQDWGTDAPTDVAPPAPPPDSTTGNLPSLDPAAMGQPPSGSPESTAHEAARGAAKGIIEAQQGTGSALPSFGSNDAPMRFTQGNPKAASAFPAGPSGPPAGSRDDQADDEVFRDVISKYPADSPERQSAIDDYFKMVSEDHAAQNPPSALPPDDGSQVPAVDLTEEQLQTRLRNHALAQPIDGLPRLPKQESALPAAPDQQEQGSALPDLAAEREKKGMEFARNMGRDPVTGQPVQDAEEGSPAMSAPDREKAVPVLQDALAKDPAGTMSELQQSASNAPKWEQEYLRRVALEIGDRPKQSVLEKLAIALTLGAGSVIGAWVTGKYNGQALIDMNEEEKAWDKRKGEIAKETYMANKGLEKAEISPSASLQRTEMTEKGKGQRLDQTEAGKGGRLETTEKGKNDRQTRDLEAKERVAGIRAATTGKNLDRMSSGDRAELDRLKMEYNSLDRMLLQYDPKVKSQGDALIKKMEAIIQKYPTK